jgi:ribosomal protein L37E
METILHAITMTYMECPQCGRKALSVATRCPHCGVAFPSKPLRRSAPGYRLDRLRPVLALGGVLLLGGALLAVVVPRLGQKGAAPARGTPSGETSPTLATPPGAVPADSAAEAVASDGVAPEAGAPDRAAPAQPRAASTASVTPTPASPLATRFARTWVNVRDARSRAAPAVRVLNPGDAVQVDSLIRGWYRVLIGGRAAGYVHRSNLDPIPPPR